MTTATRRMQLAWNRGQLMQFINHRQQLTFFNQLHAMVHAGMALPVALSDLAQYAPSTTFRTALLELKADLQRGLSLTAALNKQEALFDTWQLELLAFAETAGKLEPILDTIISQLKHLQALRMKALTTALYPLFLLLGFIFVGPLLELPAAANSGASLGALYVAGLLRNVMVSTALLLGVLLVPVFIAALDAEPWWDTFKQRLPVIGPALLKLASSQFVMTLGLAVGAGLDMHRSFTLAARSTASARVQAASTRGLMRLRSGSTLVDAVTELHLLDRQTLGSLAIAEKTGTLENTLAKVSADLQESALLAIRLIVLSVIAMLGAVVMFFIVKSMLGVIFGPVKKLYDAAGSGNLDSL